MARLEALIRRYSGYAATVFKCSTGCVVLDPACARVTLDGQVVGLITLEYLALRYLMRQMGEVLSKTELSEHICQADYEHDSNVIEVLINRLRTKLSTELIETHRGLGYKITGIEEEVRPTV